DFGAAMLRRDELFARWRDELGHVSGEVRRIHAARLGRSLFGLACAAGALVMGVAAVDTMAKHGLDARSMVGAPATFLVVAWPAAVLAYVVGRLLARRGLATRLARSSVCSPDPYADIARFERACPGQLAAQLATRTEVTSIALPLMGISMLL